MPVKLYSLLEYTVSIKFKNVPNAVSIPLGGMGSYIGSIAFTKDAPNITKTVDTTGSGIFSFSANNSGTVTVEISYLSVKVQEMINRIIARYYSANGTDWKTTLLDITISKNNETIIEATNCMLQGLPDLTLGAEVGMRTFVFQAIEIKEHTATTALEAAMSAEV
jgi:hypothetical protein